MQKHKIQNKDIGYVISYLLLGLTSITLGILSIFYDYQEVALNERIKVRPWLPAYEMWRHPSASGVDIGIKMYLFAAENPYEFLSNSSAKLKLKEIGPIVYKKILRQENIKFHNENSTMTYSSVFDIVFDEERTAAGILNQTITVVNPMLLGFAAMAHDMFLARMAFNMIAQDDDVFLNRTVYELLWNNSSPIFDFVKKIPFASPRENAGILFNSFYPSDNIFNVNIGTKHGFKDFFKINTFNGLSRIDVYSESYAKQCPVSLVGASEGTGLPPHIGKDDVIYAYMKNLCRTYPMVYNKTVQVHGVEAYKYVLGDDIYKRLENSNLDCFKQTGDVELPDGLSDASKCAFGLPVAVSPPHFFGFHGPWENYIEGLAPSDAKHASFFTVEPTSGVQLEGIARLQSNMPLPSLENYSPNIRRFSNMIVPQFWMEYFVINESSIIYGLVKMFLLLPIIQPICVVFLFALSIFAFHKSIRKAFYHKDLVCLLKEPELAILQQPLCAEIITKEFK
ncbi:lysosome membrane protein 2-like [Eupeodes corollae]|uniref:lysosome membrane protein 2-like n=1 Tax=Eupeodes corollae TaxID=290404 RepID=UPI0024932EB2|nr:lysosome membrane protein 2-like [Eupeodes corollae]